MRQFQKKNTITYRLCKTGDFPFKCDTCEKGFKTNAHLLRHGVITHKKGPRDFAIRSIKKSEWNAFLNWSFAVSELNGQTSQFQQSVFLSDSSFAVERCDSLTSEDKTNHDRRQGATSAAQAVSTEYPGKQDIQFIFGPGVLDNLPTHTRAKWMALGNTPECRKMKVGS